MRNYGARLKPSVTARGKLYPHRPDLVAGQILVSTKRSLGIEY